MTDPTQRRRCGILRRVTDTKIVWGCHACDQEVKAGDGYLTVDVRAAERYIAAWAKYEAEQRQQRGDAVLVTDDMAKLPKDKPASWVAYHRQCDPNPDNPWDYWFDVGRADTPRKLLHWVGHLHQKIWIRGTNLDALAMAIGIDS